MRKYYPDLMVDIETLGNGPTSLILQIGACYFDRKTGDIGADFRQNIDINDSLDFGFKVDGPTIAFWLKQDTKNFLINAKDVLTVLGNFKSFASRCKFAWAHATFDFPILTNAYNALGLELPFHYRKMRDLRTLVDLSNLDLNNWSSTNIDLGFLKHDALADCLYQIRYATECFQLLKEKEKSK